MEDWIEKTRVDDDRSNKLEGDMKNWDNVSMRLAWKMMPLMAAGV